MNKRYVSLMAVIVLTLCIFSCERMTTNENVGDIVELKDMPLDYGELEAVTTDATYPDWAQLWFVDSLGVIRMARVNWNNKTMLEDIIVIGRN